MITRLPAWVWLGAASLAMVAGMVNVVGYLGFEHQAITHLTGTTTLLGAALAHGDARASVHLLLIVLGFVGGAVLSGAIIQDSTLRLGRRYGVALAIEAMLLVAAVPLFEHRQIAGAALAAMACGLQNAMTATYSGALVRTSHLTGMFTDLGVFLGHRLRGVPAEPRRLWLCVSIIGGFLLGGVAGALLFPHLSYRTLYVPAALTGTVGVAYVAYRLHRGPAGTLSQ
ncbi:YoaK family protein [Lysobacter arvi]|uniref:YoaK family protein n=1 Tax=Lysobacter arvi TaxID=3038776 RepID=A0ABU1CBG4_9GAMM|nr:YoaK family protein [Lysobacter arvi]MDR0182511.1 YoaK family protein [Lysobacter arvi]